MTTVIERIELVLREGHRAQQWNESASEFGLCDEPDWVDPYWLHLPAERSLLNQQVYLWGDSEPWEPDPPAWMTETCEHGLSAWLCEDPINHYPRDGWY
jgi:hypothetical protein